MRSDKSRWSKLIYWLSPLLLLSLGLHGLGMLVPIPETKEVIEREEELPDPIQVSELPVPLPSAEPEPEPIPEPPPEVVTPQKPESEPASQKPITIEAPLPAQPSPENPPEPPPEPPPSNTPPGATPPTPTRQARNTTGTTPGEAVGATNDFFSAGGIGDFYELTILDLGSPVGNSTSLFTLNYPVDNDSCFEDLPNEPLDVNFIAIVGDFEDISSGGWRRSVLDGELLQKTGYMPVDDWITEVLLGSVEISGFDTFGEIEKRLSTPPAGLGDPDEVYTFRFQVVLPDKPC